MEKRRLGRTGHRSSVAVLGGAAFWGGDPASTAAAFALARAAGVNHLDVAPQYGAAQQVLGPLIPEVRDDLFVACKTLRHDPDGVRAQLEESLTLLRCDAFDLYQLHAVTDVAELDARDRAVRAILAARDEGLTRWVGITGHEHSAPAAHLEALRRYDLDTVMFPVNPRLWSDPDYRRDAEALLEHAAAHDVGVMAIKAVAARPWGGREPTATTWYEPYTGEEEVDRGVRFALSTPGVHAFCTPGDTGVLQTAIASASGDTSMDAAERDAAMAAVAGEPSIFPMPSA
ncbi:MAG TPA: aldo/keto reductase [Acidimicrobiales bacterium]|nr:aldo/keto reductase [Acidimicrobiales bacterium]